MPEGKTTFDDMVLGTIEFDNAELDDLVIARTDGTPTYNFAVVVDDMEMANHTRHPGQPTTSRTRRGRS